MSDALNLLAAQFHFPRASIILTRESKNVIKPIHIKRESIIKHEMIQKNSRTLEETRRKKENDRICGCSRETSLKAHTFCVKKKTAMTTHRWWSSRMSNETRKWHTNAWRTDNSAQSDKVAECFFWRFFQTNFSAFTEITLNFCERYRMMFVPQRLIR